jgi:hypothetical protein
MTKQSQKRVLTFPRIIVSLVILLSIIGCGQWILMVWYDLPTLGNVELRETAISDPLKAELSNMIRMYKNGEIEVIDLSAATTFSWQRLYIIGPYTSPSEIDAVVGRSWRKKCYTNIGTSDGINLLVFTNDKAVVHCLDYPMNEGIFNYMEPAFQEGISPQEALFTMKNDSLIWVGDK